MDFTAVILTGILMIMFFEENYSRFLITGFLDELEKMKFCFMGFNYTFFKNIIETVSKL